MSGWEEIGSAAPAASGGWEEVGPAKASAHAPSERSLGAYGEQWSPPAPIQNPHGGPGFLGNAAQAIPETVLNMATSIPASVAGNVAGLATMASPETQRNPGYPQQVQQRVQQAMTYEPRTPAGQAVSQYNPLALLMQLLHKGGEAIKAPPGMAADSPAGMARNAAGEAFEQAPQFLPFARGEPRPAGPPRTLDPRAAERQAQMGALPVPIEDATKGQLLRDPVALRRESQLATTDVGAPLRDVYVDQNAKLLENLDVLRGRTGPKSATETEVGRRVAGEPQEGRPGSEGALTQQAAQAKRGVDQLYDKARAAGEMEGPVEIKPLLNYLAKHEDPTQVSYATAALKRLKLIKEDEFGNIVPMQASGPMSGVLTLNELEGVRRAAVAARKDGGTKGHYASELIGQIDKLTDSAGGEAYAAARQARRDYANRFEEPQAIDQLLTRDSRTDRTTALEDVWNKTVVGGSIADLNRVRDTLLNDAGDRRARDAGRKAWRDIAGQTVQHIKDEATKSAALDEAGNQNVSPAALKKTLDGLGDEKLRLILGDTAAKQLRALAEVSADLKTKPPARIAGSDTVANSLVMKMNNILDHIPILGTVARGAVRMGVSAYKSGAAGKQVKEALEPPMVGNEPKGAPIDPRLLMLLLNGTQTAPQGPPPQ